MNRLLAALSVADRSILEPHLERVDLPRGEVLYDAFSPITRGYFVDRGVVSVVCAFADGKTAETGTIGIEGFVGVGTILHDEVAMARHVVQMPVAARRVEIAILLQMLDRTPALRELLLRYSRALLCQVSQSVACNSVHSAEQRLVRWLLMFQRSADNHVLHLTQEFLAEMLGLRRPTVTAMAQGLQAAGLIEYSRGRIRILDHEGLEAVACECHSLVRQHYDRLLPLAFGSGSG